MQDEINEKCVMISVDAAKITAEALARAISKSSRDIFSESRAGPEDAYKGKISMEKLCNEGGDISNIEITDKNIRSFEKYAREYGVAYSLKRDRSKDPPRYLVFFKAKSADRMELAFREYADRMLKEKRIEKPSIRKKLREKVAISARNSQKEVNKERTRDGAR